MNTQSSAVPGSFGSQGAAPAVLSATRPMYWSVRRELWENRSIYVAPLAVAAIFLFGFLISTISLPRKMRALLALVPAHQYSSIVQPYIFAAGLIMVTVFIVGAFYCLDALHGERRDRSILFWKSLPVSDLTTVLSKASIPFVVLPLLTFAITVATQLIMLLVSSAVLMGSGVSAAPLWNGSLVFQMSPALLYHFLTMHVLGYAPIYGWLLLVSAWARRAPILWATLPLLAIGVVEKIAFNTSHFAAMLQSVLIGGAGGDPFSEGGGISMNPLTHVAPGKFLGSPSLWIGLAVTAAFLAAAVRLRRYRGPI
ncbi:MAG: ABC transporter permease [Acidobacteriia bacterium]|nr:ABC transporter permease [Terriglobia bacterium]